MGRRRHSAEGWLTPSRDDPTAAPPDTEHGGAPRRGRELMRRILREESGMALVMAVGILSVLMIMGSSLIYYAGTNVSSAERSVDDTRALALGEAGMNYARAILWNAGDPTSPTAITSGTLTQDGGTVAYSGSYDSGTKTWTLTGTGTHASPIAGAAPITRTVTSQVVITGGSSWDPAWGYLFADTSGCTNLKNSITIDAPVYARGDLCMENSAKITSDLVQVRGKVQIKDSASIGTSTVPVQDVQVASGCRYPWSGSYVTPCGSSQRVYRVNFSSTVPNITKPSVNLSYWYDNAKPGPKSTSCTTGSFPGQFDNNTSLDRSNGTQYLFPTSSYDCTVKDATGAQVGRIAYTPGNPGSFVIDGVVFFDGKLEMQGNKNVVYSGRGSIYASDEIKMQGYVNLCPVAGCDASLWNPDTTILGFVAGASSDSGFLIENYTTFHGSVYVVNDYFQKNDVNVCGPVIAQELFIENGSLNCFVPFGSLPPGAPGAPTGPAAITLTNVPNSFTTG
jgi:hypothetical protein